MAALIELQTWSEWWARCWSETAMENYERAREPVIWWTVAIAIMYPVSYFLFRVLFPKIHNDLAAKKDHWEIMSRVTSTWSAAWLAWEGAKVVWAEYPELPIVGVDWPDSFMASVYAQVGYMIVDTVATILICLFVKGTFKHDNLFLWHHAVSLIGYAHVVMESRTPMGLLPMAAAIADTTSPLLNLRWWLIISDHTAFVIPLSIFIMPVFWIVRPLNHLYAMYALWFEGHKIWAVGGKNGWAYMWVLSVFMFFLNFYWASLMVYRAYQVATGTAKHSQPKDSGAAKSKSKKAKKAD